MLICRHLFLSALDTSLPWSINECELITNTERKASLALMSLSRSPSTSPCSLMHKLVLPSSSRGFNLSRIEGLQRLAFSNMAHSPSTIDFTSTESTHSNLEAPPLLMMCSISCSLDSRLSWIAVWFVMMSRNFLAK